MKLHPGINYSHTTDKLITKLPKLTSTDSSLTYLLYDRNETELDWNYPFDFCGSLYLLERVVEVLENIDETDKIRKPNSFEFIGNKAIKAKGLATD